MSGSWTGTSNESRTSFFGMWMASHSLLTPSGGSMIKSFLRATAWLTAAVWLAPVTTPAATLQFEICIYGGTAGGAAAAVQSARMNKTVVLLEPGKHIGGLTSGGLGAT